MVQEFWRVRLGEVVINGKKNDEYLYDLCKKEETPCIAVGWGEIDLSKEPSEISKDYETEWGPLKGVEFNNIQKWISMKEGDIVIAMRSPATICAIGQIIRKHHKNDEKFKLVIIGGGKHTEKDPYGEVLLYNRIDVKWIENPEKCIKIRSLGLPKQMENILLQRPVIIQIPRNNFNSIKEKINDFEFENDNSSPKYQRKYDIIGKSDR